MCGARYTGIDLAEWTGGTWLGSVPNTSESLVFESLAFESLAFDSRSLDARALFIALSHGERDGHDFVEAAMKAGASACMVERSLPLSIPQLVVPDTLKALADSARQVRANFAGPVVAVTGSCGKTSTKEMLQTLLGKEQCHATQANWNNHVGVPLTLLELHGQSYAYSVIEAGISARGEMAHLSSMIRPNALVFTNIGAAHLEGLGSTDGVAEEKAQLLNAATEEAWLVAPVNVLERPAFASVRERAIAVYPQGESASISCEKTVSYQWTRVGVNQVEVRIDMDGHRTEYRLQTMSEGMVQNSVLAVVCGLRLGRDSAQLIAGIEAWKPANNRGVWARSGQAWIYEDSYNANPTSMRDALRAFQELASTAKRRLYLIGIMNELGSDAEDFHRAIGETVPYQKGDRLIFIGEDRLTAAYVRGAQSAGWSDSELESFSSIEFCKGVLDDFSGAAFLKGSRSCKLERLIPPTSSHR